jgi:hypothetical protein
MTCTFHPSARTEKHTALLRVDDALYVRGYNGQKSRWYQAAVRQKAGRIIAAGLTKEVTSLR